jgi:hypothetical protein
VLRCSPGHPLDALLAGTVPILLPSVEVVLAQRDLTERLREREGTELRELTREEREKLRRLAESDHARS